MLPSTILLIDDEPDICFLLKSTLTKFQYKVLFFHTLSEGLAALANYCPFLIFLDINLPDGNGLEALPLIRRDFPATEVVMISAYDGIEERSRAASAGAKAFISKPFSRDMVHRVLSLS